MKNTDFDTHDVVIVGAGPTGLAAARKLDALGIKDVIVLERERHAGGIPRHCNHTGFGLRAFGRLMKGPAFSRRLVMDVYPEKIRTGVAVTGIERDGVLRLATPSGPGVIRGRRVLFALGTRETPRHPRIVSGARPWGITTTGALQQFIHLSGLKPFKRPVIIGTELVSFSAILTLRSGGCEVVAMIEENARISTMRPGDLIARYLLGVPVLTSTRLISINGIKLVEGVTIEQGGIQSQLDCDGVVFSGQFQPENAILRLSHLKLSVATGYPITDDQGRCTDPSFFASGNVAHPVRTAGHCYQDGLRIGNVIARDL